MLEPAITTPSIVENCQFSTEITGELGQLIGHQHSQHFYVLQSPPVMCNTDTVIQSFIKNTTTTISLYHSVHWCHEMAVVSQVFGRIEEKLLDEPLAD